jgi:hypothetical protein
MDNEDILQGFLVNSADACGKGVILEGYSGLRRMS